MKYKGWINILDGNEVMTDLTPKEINRPLQF
jgi:hypothetical protein